MVEKKISYLEMGMRCSICNKKITKKIICKSCNRLICEDCRDTEIRMICKECGSDCPGCGSYKIFEIRQMLGQFCPECGWNG